MTLTFGIPLEIAALTVVVMFGGLVLLIRYTSESTYHNLIPWLFHIIGALCLIHNIRGDTISFDLLHLGILSHVLGISFQIELVRRSSRRFRVE